MNPDLTSFSAQEHRERQQMLRTVFYKREDRDFYFVLRSLLNPISADRQCRILVPDTVFVREGRPQCLYSCHTQGSSTGCLRFELLSNIHFINLRKLFLKANGNKILFPMDRETNDLLRLTEDDKQVRRKMRIKGMLKSSNYKSEFNKQSVESLLNNPSQNIRRFKQFKHVLKESRMEQFEVRLRKHREFFQDSASEIHFEVYPYPRFDQLIQASMVSQLWRQVDMLQLVQRRLDGPIMYFIKKFDLSR